MSGRNGSCRRGLRAAGRVNGQRPIRGSSLRVGVGTRWELWRPRTGDGDGRDPRVDARSSSRVLAPSMVCPGAMQRSCRRRARVAGWTGRPPPGSPGQSYRPYGTERVARPLPGRMPVLPAGTEKPREEFRTPSCEIASGNSHCTPTKPRHFPANRWWPDIAGRRERTGSGPPAAFWRLELSRAAESG